MTAAKTSSCPLDPAHIHVTCPECAAIFDAPIPPELDRLRSLVGPDCPHCGLPLRTRHVREMVGERGPLVPGFRGREWSERSEFSRRTDCRISEAEIAEKYPEIAAVILGPATKTDMAS